MSASTPQLSLRTLHATLILACAAPVGLAIGAGNWHMLPGVAERDLTGCVHQMLEVMAVATSCALAAALLLARGLERCIERLIASAGALGRGEMVDIPRLWLREAEHAACALRHVGTLLALRGAERDQAIRLNAQLQARAERLAHAADHDALTGLSNRARFHAALQRHLDANLRAGAEIVVFFIDVDDFKVVNDTHGHGVGDEVLRVFARRLCDSVRDTDLVARLGGDEFAVLLVHASADQAQSLARDLTERLSQPYEIGGEQVSVSASIGMASAQQLETTAKDLLEAADAAMYVAKEGGKRRFAVSEAPMLAREPVESRANLHDVSRLNQCDDPDLRQAVKPAAGCTKNRVPSIPARPQAQSGVASTLACPMKSTFFLRSATVVACVCAAGAAPAQQAPVPQAPQVTPRDLRPETKLTPPAALPRTAPETAPAQAESLFVTVTAIALDGSFDELAPSSQALLPQLVGQRRSVADFYRLAAAIEALYHGAGYPLVRVTLPPQSLADGGTLHLRVVDGFIERVDAAGVPEVERERVQRTLAPLVGRTHLRAAALERALTLAGRLPGLSLRSALGAGQAAGATVLVVEGEVTGHVASLEADDRLGRSLGPWESTLQLRVNEPLRRGLGEQLYGYMSTNPNPSRAFATLAPRVVGGFGVQFPIGLDGLQINPEYTSSDTNPPAPPQTLRTESKFERYTLRAIYPLLLDHAQELTLTGTLEATTQSTLLPDFAFTLNQDRLRVGRLALDWTGTVTGARVHAGATASQGIAGLGYRSVADANASLSAFSRPGMRPDFSKLELALSADIALPQGLQSTTSWRSQLAKGVLPSSELFSLDGEDSLSAYTSGALSADEGYTLREELGKPLGIGSGDDAVSVTPYGYAAYGRALSKFAGDPSQGRDAAYGAGLRAGWHTFSFSAEYGRRWAHQAALDGNQLFVKAQVQF